MRAAAKAGMQIGEAETKHFGPLLWSEGGHRLTKTISLPRSGKAVTGRGISLDHAAITWGGGCRPGCCCGMGIALGGLDIGAMKA